MASVDLDRLAKLARRLERILDANREDEIHVFLNDNPALLRNLLNGDIIESKFRLADKYVTDFVSFAGGPRNCFQPPTYFIEIEQAKCPLFTKGGDPSSQLTHAIRQVEDWREWISQNRAFLTTAFQQLMVEHLENPPGVGHDSQWGERVKRQCNSVRDLLIHGFDDAYLIIAGRRSSMTVSDRIRLGRMNHSLGGIRIITYDTILDALLRSIEMQALGNNWWT